MVSMTGAQTPAPSSGRALSIVRTRVEPKTFFANERTFLQWLQISVLVMLIAMGLLTGSLVGTSGGGSMSCDQTDSKCFALHVSHSPMKRNSRSLHATLE